MTTTIARSTQVSIFSTIGGIGSAISLMWLAAHGGVELCFSMKCAKTIAGIVTAGGFPAAVLSWLFEKYGWRHPIFHGWLVKVPDLSGIWERTSKSAYFQDDARQAQSIPMTATIDHRFDDIIFTQEGQTKSIGWAADLTVDSKDTWTLIVTYDNYPQGADLERMNRNPALARNSREHRGTHVLTLHRPLHQKKVSESWELDGEYWTDKERSPGSGDHGTTGTLHLKWVRPLPKAKLLT